MKYFEQFGGHFPIYFRAGGAIRKSLRPRKGASPIRLRASADQGAALGACCVASGRCSGPLRGLVGQFKSDARGLAIGVQHNQFA